VSRTGLWIGLLAPPAIVALLVFAPWAIRDWIAFGSPFPGQALTNALSLDGRDIFAWQERPTLTRYLEAGVGTLLELRWLGFVHNVQSVLLLLGVPVSAIGLLGLAGVARPPRPVQRSEVAANPSEVGTAPSSVGRAPSSVDPLRPLLLFSVLTFLAATLLFPVSTTWGTFLHAAGAIQVLLVISALLVLDRLIAWVGARRAWTRPVAWLGPTFAIAGCLLFSAVLLPADGRAARDAALRYEALASTLTGPDGMLAGEPGPVITDFPIWFAETTGTESLALPNESAQDVLILAQALGGTVVVVESNGLDDHRWPGVIDSGAMGASCFEELPLDPPDGQDAAPATDVTRAFRVVCP
jgi:hypothetical protein